MFHLDLPNVYKVLTNGEIKLDAAISERHGKDCGGDDNGTKSSKDLRGKPVVVVSVFGSTAHQVVRGARFKRAFQLALDGFGTLSMFSGPGVGTAKSEKGKVKSEREKEKVGLGKDSRPVEEGSESNDEEGKDIESNPKDGDAAAQSENVHNLALDSEEKKITSTECLEGFLNEDESVLFIHVEGFSNKSSLCLDACKELCNALSASSTQESSFLSMWSSLNTSFCKWLLLLFSMSHVMILSESGSSFDTSYISLFRALDSVRQDILSSVSRILSSIEGLPKQWVDHARLCSPRLLFVFEMESDNPSRTPSVPPLTTCLIKEKKTALQNEIYQIFRKCRIITNISANSLFAIPASDDFVFIFDKSAQNSDSVSQSLSYTYMDLVASACKKPTYTSSNAIRSSSNSALPVKMSFRQPGTLTYSDSVSSFRAFLSEHISIALTKGFDDDYRRVSGNKHFFVLPTIGQWEAVYQKLSKEVIIAPSNRRILEAYARMRKYINVDSEYLEIQCAELFPKVYAAYQRGLPEFYTAQQHQTKLTYAVNVFLNISRGPGVIPWLKKLATKCEKYWKNGRQQCETLSLLGHVCVNPMHRIRRKDHLEIVPLPEMDNELPETPHSSSSRIVSYCNCGKRQGTREEPFTIREANYDFYKKLSKDCCDKLETYEFSVFHPPEECTDELSLQDMLMILQQKSESLTVGKSEDGRSPTYDLATQESQEVFEAELRQEDGLEDQTDDSEEEEALVETGSENAPGSTSISNSVLGKPDSLADEIGKVGSKLKKDNGLIYRPLTKRSSSTVEYLPGMMHSKSPMGLLTLFPSWSLVCLGASSIYSHSHGVHQPGFINGANGLLPWDVKVKAEKGVTYAPPTRMFRGRRHSSKQKLLISNALSAPTDEFSVKVFFGFEYECRKGHRFFCDSDKVLCALNYSLVTQKTIAGKVIASDMPLYTYCPCKEGRDTKQIAQLIRMHVVTPKAPVFVTVNPKVLPGPVGTCSTFSTGEDLIKLTPSTYWILRLPFSYVGDVVYVPPSDVTRYNGRLLKGILNVVSMNPSETEEWEKLNQGRI